MMFRSDKLIKRLQHTILLSLSGLLFSFSAFATASGPISIKGLGINIEQQIALLHAPTTKSVHVPKILHKQPFEVRFVEARRTLTDLQAFVEDASAVLKLGDRLEVKRIENDRLRRSLLANRAARDAFEGQIGPSERLVSALARTVVRNWLTTIRGTHQLQEAEQELAASKTSWQALEQRLTGLKKTLSARRAEIHALRANRAALSVELGRLRQQVSRTVIEAGDLERERDQVRDVTRTLGHDVAARLRDILLDSGD